MSKKRIKFETWSSSGLDLDLTWTQWRIYAYPFSGATPRTMLAVTRAAALFSAKSGYIFLRPAKTTHGFQKHFAQSITP
jgi:hypothetical protein